MLFVRLALLFDIKKENSIKNVDQNNIFVLYL